MRPRPDHHHYDRPPVLVPYPYGGKLPEGVEEKDMQDAYEEQNEDEDDEEIIHYGEEDEDEFEENVHGHL